MAVSKIVLEYLQVLVWPTVLAGVLLVFRKKLGSLLDRVQSASWGNSQVQFQQQSDRRHDESTPPTEAFGDLLDGVPFGSEEAFVPNPAYTDALERAQEAENACQDLQKELNAWRWSYHYEHTYNLIFGSQIRLLQYLASRGPVGASAADLYRFYVGVLPQFQNYPFDAFLGWLVTQQLIAQNQQGSYTITDAGVYFLEYMKNMNYLASKPF